MYLHYISEIICFQIIIYLFLRNAFNGRISKRIIICPIISLVLIFLLKTTNYNDVLFFATDVILYFVLPPLIVTDIKRKRIIYSSIVIVGFFSLVNIVPFFLSTFFSKNSVLISTINILLDVVLLTIAAFLFKRQKFKVSVFYITSLSKWIKIVSTFFIWELVILFSLLTVCLLQYPNSPTISFVCFLIIVVMIISFAAFYMLFTNNLRSKYYKTLNKTLEANANSQVKYYEQLLKSNDDLRKFRHDLNNIKIGLNSYLSNNDVDGATEYLNSLNIIITDNPIIFHTGNSTIDSLLSDKANYVKNSNINILFEGIIPECSIKPVELCIIIGNILDNAIESCQKINNSDLKVIKISSMQKQNFLFITITNPVNENVIINNDNIPTTKSDTETHGIGLYSVKQVLNNYNGHLHLSCKDRIFTVEIDYQTL